MLGADVAHIVNFNAALFGNLAANTLLDRLSLKQTTITNNCRALVQKYANKNK